MIKFLKYILNEEGLFGLVFFMISLSGCLCLLLGTATISIELIHDTVNRPHVQLENNND